MTPTQRHMPGNILGNRYMLLSLIAKGGMGEVWKSRDQLTGKVVAVKVLRPELSGESLPLNRLRLEAQNTLRIEHPNIASVFDSGEDHGRGWIVMELVDGRPLTDYLKGGQRLAPQHLIPVLIQMAMALGAAAEAGVVHRDIKPANVLIRPNGTVKLTDFGISRTKDQVDLTQAGMVMGTAQYLPPEQALGELATTVGDLYSVGVIAYEASAGKRPFTGKSQVDIAFAHVHDELPPLPTDVPDELASVIYHLLEKEPSKRPENGQALVRELVQAAQALDIPITATPLPDPISDGETESVRSTAAQPVLPPVRHTPRRSLPDEMLAPVDMDSARLDTIIADDSGKEVQPEETQPESMPQVVPASADKPSPARLSWRPASSVTTREHETDSSQSTTRARPSIPWANVHSENPSHPAQDAAGPRSFSTRRNERASRPQRPSEKIVWESVTKSSVEAVGYRTVPPQQTAYSRSIVAPALSATRRALRWVAAIIVALLLFALLSLAAYNFIGSRLPGATVPGTAGILMPVHTDGTLGSPDYQEAHHV